MSTVQSAPTTAAAPATTSTATPTATAGANSAAVVPATTAPVISTTAGSTDKADTSTTNGEIKQEKVDKETLPYEKPRIWRSDAPHPPLPKDTEKIIEEATRPLDSVTDALHRPYVQKSLSNNLMEIMAWDLMETMTIENEYNQHIRRFLNILIGDDPETAHVDLIDNYNMEDVRVRDQLLQLVHESLSRSDEFLHRVGESRSKIAFAIEQRNQLKTRMEKTAVVKQKQKE